MAVKHVDMKLQSVSRDGAYASRFQIPLVLAWAETVHGCQGLSMDAAVKDLAPCFVDGADYVALSRVRSIEGIHIQLFSRASERALSSTSLRRAAPAAWPRQRPLPGVRLAARNPHQPRGDARRNRRCHRLHRNSCRQAAPRRQRATPPAVAVPAAAADALIGEVAAARTLPEGNMQRWPAGRMGAG